MHPFTGLAWLLPLLLATLRLSGPLGLPEWLDLAPRLQHRPWR